MNCKFVLLFITVTIYSLIHSAPSIKKKKEHICQLFAPPLLCGVNSTCSLFICSKSCPACVCCYCMLCSSQIALIRCLSADKKVITSQPTPLTTLKSEQ